MKACFFSHVADRGVLELIEWYRHDIQILRELGFDLVVATRLREIPSDADYYFSWWCTGSILPLVITKLRRKPLVILGYGSEVVNSIPQLGYNALPLFKRAVVRANLHLADQVLSISHSMHEEASRLGRKDVPVVYLAVDTDYFRPASVPGEKRHILTISHLNKPNTKRKALKTIIRCIPHVLKEFPEQGFVMAGARLDAYEELVGLAQEFGVEQHISFPGQVSREQKLALLQGAAVYLQPTYHEGFGMAIAEAMSCGVPVITSRVGAVPEVTGDLSNYVDADDPKALGEAIISLLKNANERQAKGQAGREWIVGRFSLAQRHEGVRRILTAQFS